METSNIRKRMPVSALLDAKIVWPAIGSAFVKLDPRRLIKNPVMFVLEVVTALTTVILVLPLMYLGWTAVATVVPSAVAATNNAGPHGFSEMLYLYTSSTGNNGSAFAGISANTMFYNLTGAVAMFVGRFWMIIPAMAIAGSLVAKKTVPASAGTFPTTGGLFVGLVVGVIVIVGGLTFFPALSLGPIVEHLAMIAKTTF